MLCKVSKQLKENCRRSLSYNITCILYTKRYSDGHRDSQADFIYLKTFVLRGHKKHEKFLTHGQNCGEENPNTKAKL